MFIFWLTLRLTSEDFMTSDKHAVTPFDVTKIDANKSMVYFQTARKRAWKHVTCLQKIMYRNNHLRISCYSTIKTAATIVILPRLWVGGGKQNVNDVFTIAFHEIQCTSLIKGVSSHSQRIQTRIPMQLNPFLKFTNCKTINLYLYNGSGISVCSFSSIHTSWTSSYKVQIGKAAILECIICFASWIMSISESSLARWILKPTISPHCKCCR